MIEPIEVCGVPAFLATGPRPWQAGLVFDVGPVDEPVPVRGITHLCEHLVLSDLDRRTCDFNGSVSTNATTFAADGTSDEIVGFVHDVVERVTELPVERIEQERAILTAEGEGAGGDVVGLVLQRRYGAASYGRTGFPELGLHHLDADACTGWASQYFRADNAALWIIGPDPQDVARRLRFELPAGIRPVRDPLPAPRELPRRFADGVPGPILSIVAPRVSDNHAAFSVLYERLYDQIRHDRALAYNVAGDWSVLDPTTAHLLVQVDALGGLEREATDAMHAVIDELAERGPSTEEVDWYVERVARRWLDADDAAHAPWSALLHVVAGGDRHDALWAETAALTSESIRGAFVAALESGLFLAPAVTAPNDRFPLRATVPPTVDGIRYRTRQPSTGDEIIVGPDGITSLQPEDPQHITVRWPDCPALLCWDEGHRVVLSPDGSSISIAPGIWLAGARLVASIDDLAPTAVRVLMGSQPEPATEPNAPDDAIPPPARPPATSAPRPAPSEPFPWWAWVIGVLLLSALLRSVTRCEADDSEGRGTGAVAVAADHAQPG